MVTLNQKNFPQCDACALGKLTRAPSTHSFHRSPAPLNLVHSDLIGPISPSTKSGYKYIVTFIDDHTRFSVIYLMKSKDQTFEISKQYKTLMEKKCGRKIMKLKSDRGGEYSSAKFLQYLADEGIETERGPADRPKADSVAEQYNRTLLSKLRSQLAHSGLPLSLWGEAARYCETQINCSPSAALKNASPIDILESLLPGYVHPFDTDRLKPFGCLCYAMDKHRKSKVAPISRRFIFVGLEDGARAARLWDKQVGWIFVTGDVIYREVLLILRM